MSKNRLACETSPYLLQHKDNPVHWRAWGPEALAEAKATGKPILLSVGYAACHWCHVMAHESFEDEATAAAMNELYVSIKVDREERPDIDAIYMGALHRMGEQGGWPLTMFLDSDARPFWGGTYFPPESKWGKPSFQHVLREVARIYREDPERVAHNAAALVASLSEADRSGARLVLGDEPLRDLTGRMARAVDPVHGGLKGAPKFPQWSFFWLLWRGAIRYGHAEAKQAVLTTLGRICQGGIYDHLGGGFARYSVDEYWLVPHFEKMLYDNALLIDLMTEAWRETREPLFKERIAETVDWLAREMIAEGGGFAASLDADSEGEEGKFYVWSLAEVMDVLGREDGLRFAAIYGITEGGNFEGRNIPNQLGAFAAVSDETKSDMAGLRAKLLLRRGTRIRPGWDDKVLADWNGLMIAALAHAAVVFDRPDWLAMAERAHAFVLARMAITPAVGSAATSIRLWHSYRAGEAKAPATAADYANMIWGALRLHQATGRSRYLDDARALAATLDRHYWMEEAGGYATSADDTGDVIVRLRSAHDDAVPNANATMISNLVQLYLLTGHEPYRQRAEALPDAFAGAAGQNALGHCGVLAGCLDLIAPMHVVVVGGDALGRKALLEAAQALSLPGAVVQSLDTVEQVPLGSPLSGKRAIDGSATAYVCVGMACSAPLTDPAALQPLLRAQRAA